MANASVRLREAVLTGGLATPRFFNGRLLSGEVLTQLQLAGEARLRRLGTALGAGIVNGLWVQDAGGGSPALRVSAGAALDMRGEVLRLTQDVEIALTAGPEAAVDTPEGPDFQARPATELPTGSTSAVPGAYVLIAGTTRQPRGRAPVSGGLPVDGRCNVREDVEGVVFRAASVVSPELLQPSSPRFRNQVAALCFGGAGGEQRGGAGGVVHGPPCLLDEEALAPSEVPLAVFHIDDGHIDFVDCWAVRRRVTALAPSDPSSGFWARLAGDEHRSLMEAMTFHFLDALAAADLARPLRETFAWLPPAGLLATEETAPLWRNLLADLAPPRPRVVDLDTFLAAFRRGLDLEPFTLDGSALPVEVYLAGGAALFVRSTKARLCVEGPPGAGGTPRLHVRRVADSETDPEADGLLDSRVDFVTPSALGGSSRYVADLEPGTYRLELDTGTTTYRRLAELVGGRTIDPPIPFPAGGGEVGWHATPSAAPDAGERRVEVGVAGPARLPGGEGGAWYRVGAWHFDPGAWPEGVTLALRAEASVSAEGVAGYVRFVRASNGALAAGPLTFGATEVSSQAAAFAAPGSPTTYVLQASCDAPDADASFALLAARAIVTG